MMYKSYLKSLILYLVVYTTGQVFFLEVYDYTHELFMMLMYGAVFISFVFPVIFITRSYNLNFRYRLSFALLDAFIYAVFFLDLQNLNEVPHTVILFYLLQSCCIAFSIVLYGKNIYGNFGSLESKLEKE